MEELEIKEKIEELEKDHESSHPPSSRWRSLAPMTTLITDCRTAIELKRLTNMTIPLTMLRVIDARLNACQVRVDPRSGGNLRTVTLKAFPEDAYRSIIADFA